MWVQVPPSAPADVVQWQNPVGDAGSIPVICSKGGEHTARKSQKVNQQVIEQAKEIEREQAKKDISEYKAKIRDRCTSYFNKVHYNAFIAERYKILGDTENYLKHYKAVIDIVNDHRGRSSWNNNEIAVRLIYQDYENAHFALAPYYFHYFLLCMEWDYKPEMKFYANRFCVMQSWAQEMERLEKGELDILGLSAPPRTGKAQPLYSKILTPDGWTTMGEIGVGDMVIGADGKPCKVTDVFPQGEKDIYRVWFDDNTYTDCVGEHLWTVSVGGEKQVITTNQMKSKIPKGVFVPVVAPIEFNNAIDKDLHELGRAVAQDHIGILDETTKLSLISRTSLLEGYLEAACSEVNTKLVENCNPVMVQTARSIGYKVTFDGDAAVFEYGFDKRVTRIEPIGRYEAKCIMVDHPEHLYVTDDYILTHNSGIETLFMLWVAGRHPDKSILFATHTNAMAVKIMQDFYTMATDPKRQYSRIFPNVTADKIEKSAEYLWVDFVNKPEDNNYKTIYFRGIDGSFAGVLEASWLIVVDDLIKNIEEAMNPTRLETARQKYGVDITQRRTDDSVKELHVATRWSMHDVLSELEADNEGNPRAEFIKVPGLNENGESNFNFPYRPMTKEHFEKLRRSMDEVSFECIIQQNPIERDGLIFTKDSLSYYEGVLPSGEPDEVVFWADLAFGGGDYLSMPIAYVYGNDAYIHDVVHTNKHKFETKPMVVNAIMRNKCTRGGGEANNGGDEYMADVDEQLRENEYRCHIITQRAPTIKNKLNRILDSQAEIKALITDDSGFRLHFLSEKARANNPMYQKYMEHLMNFNQSAKYIGKQKDDAADATAGLVANILSRNNRSGRVVVLSRKWLAI